MKKSDAATASDVWSDWLLRRRHAGDAAYDRALRPTLDRIADRVLDAAGLAPGMTLATAGWARQNCKAAAGRSTPWLVQTRDNSIIRTRIESGTDS